MASQRRRHMGQYIAQIIDSVRAVKKALYQRSDPPELEQGFIRLAFGLVVLVSTDFAGSSHRILVS